ncbi:uncharacterized protein LOC125496314 [Beta vulgaris subsp. vulgaris]|uniref:uncharacterized protein LOC125496314 n=1 Tax=Beta vulgaris subsp. vulgaris TaxID=3555 RepID=UPI002036C2A2|nr:uncharacterized protein LOC125496314 [Beta vulgaris subsp. vulgaris]
MSSELAKHGGCRSGCVYAAILLCLLLQPTVTSGYIFHYRYHAPEYTIQEFTVSALKETRSTNSSHRYNNNIHFNLRLINWDDRRRIFYDTLNLSFYYKPNNLASFSIGNSSFPPFHERHFSSNRIHRIGNVEARGVDWENVTAAAAPVIFRVELATTVRFENDIFSKTKRYHIMVGADLRVNAQGNLIKRKFRSGVRLTSGATRNFMACFVPLFGILFTLFFFHSW